MLSGCAYSPRGADSAVFSQRTGSVITSADETSKNEDRERPLMMNKAGKGNGAIPSSLQSGAHRGSSLSESGYNLLQRDARAYHGTLSPVVRVVD